MNDAGMAETPWHAVPARLLRSRTWQYLLFFVLSCLPYGDTHFSAPMQNSAVDLTAAIVESGTFTIDPYASNSPDVAWKNGHYYSGLAPGISFMAVPVYAVARTAVRFMPAFLERLTARMANRATQITGNPLTPRYREMALTHFLLTLLLGGVAGAISVLLVKKICAFVIGSEAVALQIALIYALGTVMVYYTASYYTQSVATCLLLASVYFLLVRGDSRHLLLGGLLGGVAGITDYPYILYGGLVVLFALVGLWRRKSGRATALGLLAAFGLPLALAMLYHDACFGNFFETGYRNRAFVPFHARSASLGIGLPTLDRLRALFLSADEGMLLLFPFAILAPLGVRHHLRKLRLPGGWHEAGSEINGPGGHAGGGDGDTATTAARRRSLVNVMALLLLISAVYFTCIPWRSDMGGYGPRFFLCGMAFLPFFSYPVHRRLQPVFLTLVVYSVLINHLNLMSLRPLHALGAWLTSTGAETQSVRMFPPLIRLPWLKGLVVDVIYQAILVGLIFVLPARWDARRARDLDRAASPAASAAGFLRRITAPSRTRR